MSLFGSIGGAVLGSAVSGWLGNEGAEDANHASAKSAAARMAWEERMSNTSYQRAVKDMTKAGLSPMLAYSQGGASTPSGAQFQAINENTEMAKAAGSATQTALNAALTKSQVDKTEAETQLASAQAAEATARIPTYESSINLNAATVKKIDYEAQHLLSSTNLNSSQQAKVMEEIKNLYSVRGLTQAQVEETLARADLTRAQISEVAPRIAETIARTQRTNVETQAGTAALPYSELRGDVSNMLNLPKIMRRYDKDTNSAGSLYEDLKDMPSLFDIITDFEYRGGHNSKFPKRNYSR